MCTIALPAVSWEEDVESGDEMEVCGSPVGREDQEERERRKCGITGDFFEIASEEEQIAALRGFEKPRKTKGYSVFWRPLERDVVHLPSGALKQEQWATKFMDIVLADGSLTTSAAGGRLLWDQTAQGVAWWNESGKMVKYEQSGAAELGVDENGRIAHDCAWWERYPRRRAV
jgi:hypothetical protein